MAFSRFGTRGGGVAPYKEMLLGIWLLEDCVTCVICYIFSYIEIIFLCYLIFAIVS